MKMGFYPKLALDGIRKNKRLYIPFILTSVGTVMMHYIVTSLYKNETVMNIRGGEQLSTVLGFGSWVMAVFACIFLFYTNSFLIRRRKKEFGLYNILGMGKRNIGRILLWETLIVLLVSLFVGLLLGISLSKLAELGLVNMMRGDVTYSLSVSPAAILTTCAVFCVIFLLILLSSRRQVRHSTAIELLRSESAGEKPPRSNWFLGLTGALMLGAAYYIAVTIQDPLTAMAWFFIAVIMVIAGTYMLMISGSVLFCRILQKRKSYYYKPNHFVSVSSMVYRMRRNGAGLASICILATMVLVMISSTASLYYGIDNALTVRYPKEFNLTVRMDEVSLLYDNELDGVKADIDAIAAKYGVTLQDRDDYRSVNTMAQLDGDTIAPNTSGSLSISLNNKASVALTVMPLDDYNAFTGEKEVLAPDEALIYTYRIDFKSDAVRFENGTSFKVRKTVDTFSDVGDTDSATFPIVTLIVDDWESAMNRMGLVSGNDPLMKRWTYDFDTGLPLEEQKELSREVMELLDKHYGEGNHASYLVELREGNREEFFSLYAGLFFIGIALSIVLIFAAVLIIYYKQVSEGYEDQARFGIMQNVGMTKREIRRSINSQLLTVFFLPLIGAGIHLAFAFPMIRRLLLLFNLSNVMLFALTTLICFAVFSLFYMLVYRITSNAYYNIVSEAKK